MSKRHIVAVLLFIVLLAVPVLAQNEAAEIGREVTRADWIDRIPVVIGAIVLADGRCVFHRAYFPVG